ncbi:hypothetical protein BJ165DRAFT_1518986 [Panaeolus papilionaceus]|nr:hypothetical protein BJ165DRAFT_1518986 [Panaeolus papilionaceus]
MEKLPSNDATKIKVPPHLQSIIPYRIKNVTWRKHAVHIVDTPGFAVLREAEMPVISHLNQWMQNAGPQVSYHIVYLTDITMQPEGKRMIKNFQSLTGVVSATNITFATTMWDRIWNEALARRAEETFNRLRDDYWADFISAGSDLVRFHNTPESALLILETVASRYEGGAKSHVEDMSVNKRQLIDPTSAKPDMVLTPSVIPRLKEVENALHTSQEELREFQTPPTADDPDVAPQLHDSNIVATQQSISGSDNDVVHASTISPGSPQRVPSTLPSEYETGDGDGAPHVPDAGIVAPHISPPDLDDDIHGPSIISTGPPRSDPRMPEAPLPKRGIFTRATGWVKRAVKNHIRRHHFDKA